MHQVEQNASRDQTSAPFADMQQPDDVQSEDKRLRALHHYTALRLHRSISTNGTLPCKLVGVRIVGSPNTRRGFLERLVQPMLSSDVPRTLNRTLDDLAETADRLAHFGIYESVMIDIASAGDSTDPSTNIEATIRLKERSRLWARTGTDFGNQEGSAYASANARNVFGGAETVEGNIAFGTRTKTSYEMKFTSPVLANPDQLFEVVGYETSRVNAYASHDENIQGLTSKFRFFGPWATHELGLLAANRQVTNIHEGASLFVRHSAGLSRKVSLLHTFFKDTRDDPIMPTRGYYLRASQEFALGRSLGSDPFFLKFELNSAKHFHVPYIKDTVLNLGCRSGLIWDLNQKKKLYLGDRFQLGGPQSVRGFMFNGLGPRSGKDSLGGNVFLAGSASLLSPVPGAPEHWPIRLHSFVNGGSLLELERGGVRSTVHELLTHPSVSAGIGLMFRHPVARVEMSFCLPIASRSSDRTRKGLQFGLGVEFL